MDFYNCYQLNSFSSKKQWILGKNVKIRDFQYFLFEATKNPICWRKMTVRTTVEICAKLLISQLTIGGVVAISLVAMVTATLILVLDVVFELIEAGILFYIFF